jgi:tetratricopeptide (TPR) repeat protein
MSDAEVTRSARHAVEYGEKAIAIYERLLRRNPRAGDLLENLASSYSQLANAMSAASRREDALAYARKSLQTREERARLFPDDVLLRRDLMLSYTRVGDMLGGAFSQGGGGDEAAAYEYHKRAAVLAEAMAKGDPNSREAQDDYAIVLARLGGAAPEAVRLVILEKAARLLEEALRLNPKTRINRITLAIVYESMAQHLQGSARLEAALAHARSEWKVATGLVAEQPDYKPAQFRVLMSGDLVARLLAKLGRREQAQDAARELQRTVWKYQADTPMNAFYQARSWACLGEVYRAAEQWQEAREALAKARDDWRKLMGIKGPFDAAAELARIEQWLKLSPPPAG